MRSTGRSVFRMDCALPDGEGTWFFETPDAQKCKHQWADADYYVSALRRVRGFDYVICDLGGIRSTQNSQILSEVDIVVICHSTNDEVEEWGSFARASNRTVQIIPFRTNPSYSRNAVRSGFCPPAINELVDTITSVP